MNRPARATTEGEGPLASQDWYAAPGGEQTGPLPREEMERLIEDGRIGPDTLVWRQGMPDWARAADAGFFPAAAPEAARASDATAARPGSAGAPGPESASGASPATSVPPVAGTSVAPPAGPAPSAAPGAGTSAGAQDGPPRREALRGISFGKAVARYFSGYVAFHGRASRGEYWWAMLFLAAVTLALSAVDAATLGAGPEDPSLLSSLFAVLTLLPTIAVSVRRLHDIDRSGWWVLLSLVPLVGFIVLLFFHIQPGTAGPNRFGTTREA